MADGLRVPQIKFQFYFCRRLQKTFYVTIQANSFLFDGAM